MSELNPFYFCQVLEHVIGTLDTTLEPSQIEPHALLLQALSNLTETVDCRQHRKQLEKMQTQEVILTVGLLLIVLILLSAGCAFIGLLYDQGERAAWTVQAHNIPLISTAKMRSCMNPFAGHY